MKKLLLLLSLVVLSASAFAQADDCTGGVPAVYHNGLWWAWASPCSGGCSQATPDTYGYDLFGWRWVSGPDEWALRPDKSAFEPLSTYCAASYFDPMHDHCDMINNPVYQNDGSYNELWLVNDCMAADVGDDVQDDGGEIPEFTAIGAMVATAGAMLFVLKRR